MSQIKNEIKIIKKQIISVLILFFMFVMVFSTVNVGWAAENTTNLAQNILPGSIDMTAPTQLDFTNVTLTGSQQYSNINFNGVNVRDYRGSAAGWNLTAYANNLVTSPSNTTNNISITARLNVTPGNVTYENFAVAGGAFMMPNSSGTAAVVMNADPAKGIGVSNITNTSFNLNIAAGDNAGTYTATMTLTVS